MRLVAYSQRTLWPCASMEVIEVSGEKRCRSPAAGTSRRGRRHQYGVRHLGDSRRAMVSGTYPLNGSILLARPIQFVLYYQWLRTTRG